nr:MAG TPA: hypothetical protein [Caudoviricetes sp.]
MKILWGSLWLLVALLNMVNVISHIRSNRKAGNKWFDSETCAWMIGVFASLNSAHLNFTLV